ncbi:unnamed protein product [Penicillium olsonii]|uniref:Uncharacterized protein n=1 Tax=Penicillium olsonii TaxID=99116 RepID=A0A9W4HGJ7_PENOL|nr:unnamed protein product [Penicillium olsonii]CAG8040209.1 unnamed protein product [Penicillium olsonii]
MSGAEVIAVVACVAAVVSAYNDGSRILTAIRHKWHDRRRQTDHSTRDLEWSLARGHHEILSQYQEYHHEIGRRYDEGDSIAREQMKDIIITLQGALLRHLREAQEKGVHLDLMAMQIESEQGRVRTLVVLGDLFERLARPSPVFPSVSMSIDPTYRRGESYGRIYQNLTDGSRDIGNPLSGLPGSSSGIMGSFCTSPTESLAPVREFEMKGPVPSTSRWRPGIASVVSSVSDRLHPRSSRVSVSSLPPSRPDSVFTHGTVQAGSPTDPIPEIDLRPATPHPIPHDEICGNPWQHELSTDSDDDIIRQLHGTHLSPFSAPTGRRHSHPPPSISSTDSTPSNPSTGSDTTPARPFWLPSKANNYLGLCKGAWKVHSGFAGFKIHSEPGSGYYTQRSWLRCKECAFEAPMAKSSGNDPLFDETVRTHHPTGVRYRSKFLAKSHVPCKRDSASGFSPLVPRGAFCCIFCCAHQGSTHVYGNLDAFLGHLADSHCVVDRETLALLPSTRCIIGRVAGDSEYFDVNIPR